MSADKTGSIDLTTQVSNWEIGGWIATLVLSPVCYVVAHHLGMTMQGSLFTAIMATVILMWLFNLVDDYIPPLMGMFAGLFFGLAPASVALAGMASPSLLTLMGVFALASVIAESGLSRRVVLSLLLKLPNRFFWQENILVFCGLLLSLVSPSGNSRISLLLPLFKEMSQSLHLPKRGVAITSLMAATYGGAMLFSTALANSKSASVAAMSMLPTYLQNQYLGIFWLMAAALPIIFLVVIHLASIKVMFRGETPSKIDKDTVRAQLKALGKPGYNEKCGAIAFLFFFIGSLTTGIHFVNIANIAGMTILLLLLAGVFTKAGFQKSIDWPMIFFMLSMDSMMRTLSYLGLDQQLSNFMGSFYTFVDGSFVLYTLATLATTVVMRLAFPVAAGMLLSFIILLPITITQGYSPWICLFLTAMFSDIWFFRYQSSVYLTAWNSNAVLDFEHKWFMRHNNVMNLARVLCVFAAIPIWQWMELI
ncbi:SLC13 family permease [Orrella daihaiensis]|uniref:Anion permease n=1 Tax=Orrella daihaiensis TaxID=2782176 RepID=A0ABY4AIG2_9BURK|nr:SLC13 family permease [Orrella daihaiensis]UOD50085.1 anion permease [Orrella daihaiensis]